MINNMIYNYIPYSFQNKQTKIVGLYPVWDVFDATWKKN